MFGFSQKQFCLGPQCFGKQEESFLCQTGVLLLDDAYNHIVFEVVAAFKRVCQEEENLCRDQRPPRIWNYPHPREEFCTQFHTGG